MSSVYGLGRDGSPTLIASGASRVAIAGRTQPLTAVFTPTFAAPEQFTSGQQGPYTDFYATAATLYACLNGKEPISSANRMMGGASMPSDREAARGEYCRPLDCAAHALAQPSCFHRHHRKFGSNKLESSSHISTIEDVASASFGIQEDPSAPKRRVP
jgi:serine/threonine protein kinase